MRTATCLICTKSGPHVHSLDSQAAMLAYQQKQAENDFRRARLAFDAQAATADAVTDAWLAAYSRSRIGENYGQFAAVNHGFMQQVVNPAPRWSGVPSSRRALAQGMARGYHTGARTVRHPGYRKVLV